MDDTKTLAALAPTLPAVAAFFCLAAAAALASLIRLNKGAKLNRAWALMALGFGCFGLAGLDTALARLGLPNAGETRDVVAAAGALLAMIGAAYARSLYRALVK